MNPSSTPDTIVLIHGFWVTPRSSERSMRAGATTPPRGTGRRQRRVRTAAIRS